MGYGVPLCVSSKVLGLCWLLAQVYSYHNMWWQNIFYNLTLLSTASLFFAFDSCVTLLAFCTTKGLLLQLN